MERIAIMDTLDNTTAFLISTLMAIAFMAGCLAGWAFCIVTRLSWAHTNIYITDLIWNSLLGSSTFTCLLAIQQTILKHSTRWRMSFKRRFLLLVGKTFSSDKSQIRRIAWTSQSPPWAFAYLKDSLFQPIGDNMTTDVFLTTFLTNMNKRNIEDICTWIGVAMMIGFVIVWLLR